MIVFGDLGRAGRLGNALFQLASTMGIAASRGDTARVNADWMHRPYFSVPDAMFGTPEQLLGGIRAEALVPHIDPRAAVYLQDRNLFAGIMPTIREHFAPSPLAVRIIADARAEFDELARPILSVHVRRGDAVASQDPRTPRKERFHACLPLSYYQRGIDLLRDRSASIAVFGDEPEWNAAHLGDRVDYVHAGIPNAVEHETGPGRKHFGSPLVDFVDLQLMAECTAGHVLANSTFGIWAALLAGDADAVMPWPMFGPALDFIDASLLGPSTWTRLGYS